MAWVLWCVPAGALAGVGLIEFNWGGAPYDGGFLGELALFGGFLALGQAPFILLFVLALAGREGGTWIWYLAAFLSAFLWPVVGLLGWTVGSYVEVGLETPLYSGLRLLAGSLPWLFVAALETVVLLAALAFARGARVVGGAGLFRSLSWVVTGVVGGLLYEYWRSLDVAARENPLNNAIGRYLEGAGVAENLAYVVVPNALFVPLLYGIPTGLALVVIRGVVSCDRRPGRWCRSLPTVHREEEDS